MNKLDGKLFFDPTFRGFMQPYQKTKGNSALGKKLSVTPSTEVFCRNSHLIEACKVEIKTLMKSVYFIMLKTAAVHDLAKILYYFANLLSVLKWHSIEFEF